MRTIIVASLELPSAFDLVNINLLIKRLKVIGLPGDTIELISQWLNNRSFYVGIDGFNSVLFDLLLGTAQGSILEPVLCTIFVSPLFDTADFPAFANDILIPKYNNSLSLLILDKILQAITKLMKQSGLIFNQAKTEACLIFRYDSVQCTSEN
jgi:hypothetical protein